MDKPSIHTGHRKRMKEEFLKSGLDHMPPHRVLEFLLFFGIPQGDTNVLAHQLLDEFQSLSGVLDAPYEELRRVRGIGEHTAILLSLISGVARMYYVEKAERAQSSDNVVHNIGELLKAQYIGCTKEILTLVCLDPKLKILHIEQVSAGISDAVQIEFRDLARIALRYNSSLVVLAHNHPGGTACFSREDRTATATLKKMFAGIDITLYDHLVIAGDMYVSMRANGGMMG